MSELAARAPHRRVLILAGDSAQWKIAGLRQLDRLALTLQEFADAHQPTVRMEVCVFFNPQADAGRTALPNDSRLENLHLSDRAEDFLAKDAAIDLVLSTSLFLFPGSIAELPDLASPKGKQSWDAYDSSLHSAIKSAPDGSWKLLTTPAEIPACERALLRRNGKSQDGFVSRHLNRRVSRRVSRWLLKLPISPSLWSMLIFVLPIVACFAFVGGTYLGFVVGAAIFQLYSILDGCDGEIARAKFMQTEFGRRFDSLCDLVGNLMLAVSLGFGLARHANPLTSASWFYGTEGFVTAMLIITSEGIVFARRSRTEKNGAGRWNGALYRRHHELVERSGILFFGERVAWVLVQLTKRDMAMLAFLILALVGQPAWSLHLLLTVSAISSALAGKAFFRPATPPLPQEAS